jgi:hypothetical protein
MKTLNDYINAYSNVAKKLGYTGESINILVQLLANASYISEVENITYTREASLDKAMLRNSKIQHCMDNMYSVYRGHCPRVVFKVNFLRPVTFKPFDEIVKSSNFSVYFLGEYIKTVNTQIYPEGSEGDVDEVEMEDPPLYTWTYREGALTLSNANLGEKFIVGFISPSKHTINLTTNSYQNYYIESSEGDISNDVCVKISETLEAPKVTRNFSEHILNPRENVFDLTTTDYGSRIYFADYILDRDTDYFADSEEEMYTTPQLRWDSEDNDGIITNTPISTTFFTYSTLDSYNVSELQRLTVKGGDLIPFDTEMEANFLYGKYGYPENGVIFIKETPRDTLSTIHYKANRSRYLNTILRSNSDIGYILEETFPEKVKSGSTYYKFYSQGEINFLDIFYIPNSEELSPYDMDYFKTKRLAYYVVNSDKDTISIKKGAQWTVNFEITLDLFRNLSEDYPELITKPMIQDKYEKKFNIKFDEDTIEEIKSNISKISNVKKISDFSLTYYDEYGNLITDIEDVDIPESVYYKINVTITTIVRS